MQAVLTPEFLAIVSAPIRDRLMLKPGLVMGFDEETPYLKAVPAGVPDAAELAPFQEWLQASVGIAKGKLTTDARMKETREED